MCAARALDEPARRIDLVRAVDRDVEAMEAVERLDREPEAARGVLRVGRRRDTAQAQPTACERGQQVSDRGPGPEPDGGAVLDECGGGLGGGPLLVLYVRSGQRGREAL